MAVRRILHPTDFSASSRLAFELACSLAAALNAELVILHVCQPAAHARPAGNSPETLAVAQEPMAQLEQLPVPAGIPVTRRIEPGEPDAIIARVAAECRADLVVLGTHGRTGLLNRILIGSVAEKVVRTAPCPVLTVPVPRGK